MYPYNTYRINKPNLQLAQDTYHYAWDLNTDVSFKLWADCRTEVICDYKGGVLTYSIAPQERQNDVILPKGILNEE